MNYVRQILAFVQSKETSFSIDVPSRYVKNLLQGQAGALKHFKNLNHRLIAEENTTVLKISKISGKEPCFTPPQREKTMTEDEETFNELGVSLILSIILKTKVPIVLHNCLFDIGFLYTHFIDSLALTLNEFKNDVTTLFPNIYDTKSISKNIDVAVLKRLNLEGLYATCMHSNLFKNLVRFSLDDRFFSYNNGEKAHEAGFDAYMTGVIFLHLREYCKKTQNTEDSWAGIRSMKNVICLTKSHKFYINLAITTDNNERNENIIKFKVKSPLDINQIAEFLANYGDLYVRKIAANLYVAGFDKFYDNHSVGTVTEKLKETNRFNLI